MSMLNNTAVRLFLVVGVMAAVFLCSWLLQAGLEPPGVEMPDWTFKDLPIELGQWHGQPTEMNPNITAATQAAPGTTTSRIYQDGAGHAI